MTKPLHIGIVANTAFNIYNFRLNLILALKQAGHHVYAIAPNDSYVALLQQQNIECIEIKNLARKGTNPVNDLKLVLELKNIYKKLQLDVVLQYTIKPNIYGTLAAKFLGIKSVCTVTGLGYTFLNDSFASKVAHRLYKIAFTYANKVLFQNQDDIEVFIQQKLVDVQKVQIVPGSGIDTKKFHPNYCIENELSYLIKRDENITRFLMIGRLLRDKGVYEFIEAAKQILQQHSNVDFHLLGDIDTDNPAAIAATELDNWIQDKTITYHGYAKDTRPYICMADCVVLPSYREGMPRVILESMAMAKTCITTKAPGCKDAVIDGESGLLCEVANADSLRAKMEEFILHKNDYKKTIGINARVRAENIFSQKMVNECYLKILEIL